MVSQAGGWDARKSVFIKDLHSADPSCSRDREEPRPPLWWSGKKEPVFGGNRPETHSAYTGKVVLVKVNGRYFPRRHGVDPVSLFNRQVRVVEAGPATPTSEREHSPIT
jgi:hypothetical protein